MVLKEAKMEATMYQTMFEEYVGIEDDINEPYISNYLATFNFTPFKTTTDPFNLPNIDLDQILGEIIPLIEKDALNLEYDNIRTFMVMIDLVTVDLAIHQ